MTTHEEPSPVVLIVDDDEPIAEALAMIVEECGYGALVARSGQEALALVRENHPDLIITDLMMPQMSGFELIVAIRALSDIKMPPIVVMSAAGSHYIEQAEADVTLHKPFELTRVEGILNHFLQHTQVR